MLELLVAVMVFALLASGAYGVLNAMTAAAAAHKASGDRLREVQVSMMRLDRELRHTLSTGMLDARGRYLPVRGSHDSLDVSLVSPGGSGRHSEIRHLSYRYARRSLYRWPAVRGDAAPAPDPAHILLKGISRLQFSYLDASGGWRSEWTPVSARGLPLAVRVEMEVDGLGRVERWFELPGNRP